MKAYGPVPVGWHRHFQTEPWAPIIPIEQRFASFRCNLISYCGKSALSILLPGIGLGAIGAYPVDFLLLVLTQFCHSLASRPLCSPESHLLDRNILV